MEKTNDPDKGYDESLMAGRIPVVDLPVFNLFTVQFNKSLIGFFSDDVSSSKETSFWKDIWRMWLLSSEVLTFKKKPLQFWFGIILNVNGTPEEKAAEESLAEWQARAAQRNAEIVFSVGPAGDKTLMAQHGKRPRRTSP